MAGFAMRTFALLAAYELLSQQRRPSLCSAAEVRHARHKRTVSDFVEGLMNAVYFHVGNGDDDDDDHGPLPLPSTVIARITRLPTAGKVYKYVPVQTLRVSKVRARNIAEPKIKINKYPKKFSIKTGDSSITAVLNNNNNDPPWTLHPLPPPLPTAKAIRLEVDKAMPWALHPLPPPVKTKNYSDQYFWPDTRARPRAKYVLVAKPAAAKPYKFAEAYRYNRPELKPSDFRPSDDHRVSDHHHHHHGGGGVGGFERDKPELYKQTTTTDDVIKHVDHQHVDYEHVNYRKSPPDDADGQQPADSGHRPVRYGGHRGHDDRAPPQHDEYYAPHDVSIVPSVQTASDAQTLGDGTGGGRSACRCPRTAAGHRDKRDAADDRRDRSARTANRVTAAAGDTATSAARNRYRVVGHASDVEIRKSHDITDTVMPMIAVANNGGGEPSAGAENVTAFRDDSDMFKVDVGRAVGDGHRPVRRPAKEPPTGYHRVVTESAVGNGGGGGVSFSVRTPFSVSSFASDYPAHRGYRPSSRLVYGTASSSFRSDADEHLEPLDFEQFGFRSAALRGAFGGDDRFLPRPTWPFSLDSGEDGQSRRPPARYTARNRLLRPPSTRVAAGPASDDDSVLEYFRPVVVDFDRPPGPQRPLFFGRDGGDRSRYSGNVDSTAGAFSRFPRNRNPDRVRLPGGLHESTENPSRKMVFHPSTFDSDE